MPGFIRLGEEVKPVCVTISCSESFSALSHQVDIRLLSGWDVDQATLLLIAGQPARRVRFGARLSSARLWRFLAVIRWEKIERFDSGSRLGKSSM